MRIIVGRPTGKSYLYGIEWLMQEDDDSKEIEFSSFPQAYAYLSETEDERLTLDVIKEKYLFKNLDKNCVDCLQPSNKIKTWIYDDEIGLCPVCFQIRLDRFKFPEDTITEAEQVEFYKVEKVELAEILFCGECQKTCDREELLMTWDERVFLCIKCLDVEYRQNSSLKEQNTFKHIVHSSSPNSISEKLLQPQKAA